MLCHLLEVLCYIIEAERLRLSKAEGLTCKAKSTWDPSKGLTVAEVSKWSRPPKYIEVSQQFFFSVTRTFEFSLDVFHWIPLQKTVDKMTRFGRLLFDKGVSYLLTTRSDVTDNIFKLTSLHAPSILSHSLNSLKTRNFHNIRENSIVVGVIETPCWSSYPIHVSH